MKTSSIQINHPLRFAASNHDLLDMLLHVRDEKTGQQMSDQQIRDEVITIFTAGHETTANLLTWTLYLLAKHPDILKKLRSELEFLNGKTPTAENLQQLNYSRAVLNESLRIRPPVGMLMRKVNSDIEIEGYHFKSGSLVIYSIYNIHHNKTLWYDPEQFQPERFLSEKNNRFSFLPFGTGERVCIGNHFAMLESQLLLSMIIQKYDIQLTSDEEVEIDLAVSLRPKGGIPVLLRRR
ncbi:MAG: cytochrome P450 [Methylococcales bacterium]|nr:cytochrome P450 [Methylococcales bacterium]